MPNPAHDEITILSSIIPGQPYEMYAIFNAAGMAIKEFIITETSQRIDISNLPAGSYSVRLKGRKIQNMRSITFIKI